MQVRLNKLKTMYLPHITQYLETTQKLEFLEICLFRNFGGIFIRHFPVR